MTPAAASQVVITQQPPASVTAGSGFGLQAAIEDAYGNVETADQRHRDRGAGEQPRRGDAGRHALRDGEPTAWRPSPG